MNRVYSLTKQRLDQLSAQDDYRRGDLERRGWPTNPVYAAYQVSKSARLRLHEGELRATGQLCAPGIRRDRDGLQHRRG
jgi:hypothetical protein